MSLSMKAGAAIAVAFLGCALADTPPAPAFTPYPAPDFVVNMPDGQPIHLSSLKGKVVAVLCMYTTCPHCQETSKRFTELYKEFGSRGFEPIGVAFNEEVFGANTTPSRVVGDFVKNFSVGFPMGWTDRAKILDFLQIGAFQPFVVPQIVWIDKKGMIRARTQADGNDRENRMEPYWRMMIDTLTKETAGTTKTSGAKKPVASHHASPTAQK